MGQKTNPNILRLGKFETWKSKYFEKKMIESSIYIKKDFEIRYFILKYFENHSINIYDCKLHYLNSSLHIFISYFTDNSNILLLTQNISVKQLEKSQKNNKIIRFNKLLNNKNVFNLKKKIKNIKFLQIASFFNKKINLGLNIFLNNLKKILKNFMSSKINIYFIFQKINNNLNRIIPEKVQNRLKKEISSLRKYSKNEFFQKGINILFICSMNKYSSKLLAQFIKNELTILKRHNLFLKFLKNTLILFNKYELNNIKGIKIKIKGRINGRSRAKTQLIKICKGVPLLSIHSKINYSEETCFTPNGTLGIKVWVYENKKII